MKTYDKVNTAHQRRKKKKISKDGSQTVDQ